MSIVLCAYIWWYVKDVMHGKMHGMGGFESTKISFRLGIYIYIYIYKYNVSVNNTALYFIYNKNSILSGRHVSTVIRSASGPLRKQIQELSTRVSQ